MTSMFKKELLDCLKWVPAGMLIALVMVWQSLPGKIDWLYNTEADIMVAMGWSAGLIAFAFGLLQSLFDIRNDARGYLLHRPLRRTDIFWAKVAAGFVAYVLTLSPAVLTALFYLNSRGLEFLPVSGWQIIPGLLLVMLVFLLHPVGMWIGNRDARWVGTRVLPLAGIVTVLLFISNIYGMGFDGGSQILRWLMYAALWAVHIVAVVVVFGAARHAFCVRQMLPPASGKNASPWARVVGLNFSAITVATASGVLILSSLIPVEPSYTNRQLLMNADGEFQQVQIERSNWNWDEAEYSVRPATDSNVDYAPVSEEWKLAEYSVLVSPRLDRYSWFDQFRNMGDYLTKKGAKGPLRLFSHQNRLLAYGPERLKGVVTLQGVERDTTAPQGEFQKLGVFQHVKAGVGTNGQLGKTPFVVDATGLFQFDSANLEMHRLLPEGVDRACMLYADDKYPATLWTVSRGKLTRHEVSPVEDGVELTEKKLTSGNHTIFLPLLRTENSKSYEIDLPNEPYSISVFRNDDGQYGYVKYDFDDQQHYYGMLSEDGGVEKIGPQEVPPVASANQDYFGLAIPSVVAFGVCVWALFFGSVGAMSPYGLFVYAVAQALLAGAGTFLLCKWLDLSSRTCWIWTVVALLGGWGICIAVMACHRRLVKEACPHCHKQTRVDLEECTLCGRPWLPPELDQIEIFDGAVPASV